MAEMTITNPTGANQRVTDFRLFTDEQGNLLPFLDQDVVSLQCNAAILKGRLVALVVPTLTQPVRITTKTKQAAVNTEGRAVYGVALESGAAGETIRVCVRGLCEVLVNTGDTPAFGDWGSLAVTAGNDGEVDVNTGAAAATVVVGEHLGMFLGGKTAQLLAPFYFDHY